MGSNLFKCHNGLLYYTWYNSAEHPLFSIYSVFSISNEGRQDGVLRRKAVHPFTGKQLILFDKINRLFIICNLQ